MANNRNGLIKRKPVEGEGVKISIPPMEPKDFAFGYLTINDEVRIKAVFSCDRLKILDKAKKKVENVHSVKAEIIKKYIRT